MTFRVYTTQYIYLSHIEDDVIAGIIERYLDDEGDIMEEDDPDFAHVLGWIEDYEPESKNLMLGFMAAYHIRRDCTIEWISR